MLPRSMARTISIVGAGRVGRALGKRLRERGWRIGAVVTRSRATALAAVRAIGGGTAFSRITGDALEADVILLGTPDDVMRTAVRSLPEIGRRFGGRDHTTVLHAVRKIEGLVGNDMALAEEIEILKRQLQE